LEQLYRDLNNGHLETKEEFIKDFEQALQKEIMTDADSKARLEHGRKVLSTYYDFHKEDFAPCISTEKNFGTSLSSQVYLDDIPLTGKVDRIEFLSPSLRGADATRQSHTTLSSLRGGTPTWQSHTNKEVRVVDYKTGKPKTRNEIEGNTKNSTGDYKRQLVFYELLTKLDKSFQYEVTETELHFIEPDAKGDFHKERFSITSEDLTILKKEIRSSVDGIRSLNFPRTDDLNKCATCPFKSHCGR